MTEAMRPFEILMVEDNPGDVRLTREALVEHKVLHRLHTAGDGQEALAFLERTGRYADAPRPDLILLDLNLPRIGGREVLAQIKQNPSLRLIPVVILTTSSSDEDVLKSYGMHANCYITKPVDFERFVEIVRAIEMFWFGIVTLPQHE